MLMLKACPRCRGDLYIDRDIYGQYKQCIQCGHMEDLAPATRASSQAPVRSGKNKVIRKAA